MLGRMANWAFAQLGNFVLIRSNFLYLLTDSIVESTIKGLEGMRNNHINYLSLRKTNLDLLVDLL